MTVSSQHNAAYDDDQRRRDSTFRHHDAGTASRHLERRVVQQASIMTSLFGELSAQPRVRCPVVAGESLPH